MRCLTGTTGFSVGTIRERWVVPSNRNLAMSNYCHADIIELYVISECGWIEKLFAGRRKANKDTADRVEAHC